MKIQVKKEERMKKQDSKTHAQACSPMLERGSLRKLQYLEKDYARACDPKLEHTTPSSSMQTHARAHSLYREDLEDLKTTLERSPSRSSVDAINQEILLRRSYLLGEDLGVYKRDLDAVLSTLPTTYQP